MKKSNSRFFILIGLSIFLLACNCNLLNLFSQDRGFQSNKDSNDSLTPIDVPKYEATQEMIDLENQLIIVDQLIEIKNNQLYIALLLKNTNQENMISRYRVKLANDNDSTNVNSGWNNLSGIYPNQQSLFCTHLKAPEGTKIENISLSVIDIKGQTTKSTNPLETDQWTIEKNLNQKEENIFGYATGEVMNHANQSFWDFDLKVGVFNSSGDLVGCGDSRVGLEFIGENSFVPASVPVWSLDPNPQLIQVFPEPILYHSKDLLGIFYGKEPIQITDVDFSQNGNYIYPIFSLTNTLEKETIINYGVNLFAYDEKQELVLFKSYNIGDIPPEISIGPYQEIMGQVETGSKVAKLEVQVVTIQVQEFEKILRTDSLTFEDIQFTPNSSELVAKAKNSENFPIFFKAAAVCLNSDQKPTGNFTREYKIPAKSELDISFYRDYGPFFCDETEKLKINLLDISPISQ